MMNRFRVGPWLVEPKLNAVSGDGKSIHIEPRVMEVLVYLAERHGKVVAKQELISAVWTDVFVTDDVLTRAISELRRAFEDDPKRPQFIETIPKRGYRLIPPVELAEQAASNGDTPGLKRNEAAAISTPAFSLALGLWRTRDLAWVGLILLVAGMTAGSLVYVRQRLAEPIHSLAVLPFQNASGGPDNDCLGEIITESLINGLSQLPRLIVKSHHSVDRYKGREADVQAVGRELNVHAVLLGRVARHNADLTVSVELVDTRTNDHLWGKHYTCSLSDVATLQAKIEQDIASQLRLKKSGEDRGRMSRQYSGDPRAYQAYVRGRFFWNSRQASDSSRRQFLPHRKGSGRDNNQALTKERGLPWEAHSGSADGRSSPA